MTTEARYRPQLRRRAVFVAALAATSAITLAACSSSSSGSSSSSSSAGASSSGSSSSSSSSATGTVNVLYAGSLVDLMEKQISPGFEKSTGNSFSGFSGGSSDLAADIKGKVRKGDVFVSASPDADASIMGSANGDWVKWYATFATSPVVIGYNPKSKFAAQLKKKPWYDVITEKGFRLGRTDPATDPKGKLAAQALTDQAAKQHDSQLSAIAKSTSGVYPEETLVGRLQAGQLDAGFFYTAEATAAKIKTVPLTGESLKATYTVTVLNQAPNADGGASFVKYLLGAAGLDVLKKDGFTLVVPPSVTGSGVPSSLQSTLSQ